MCSLLFLHSSSLTSVHTLSIVFSLLIHHFPLGLATLSLLFQCFVIQNLCFYNQRNPCVIHNTVFIIGLTILVVFVHTLRSCLMSWLWILLFALHVLMLCRSFLSFRLHSVCVFFKSIFRRIHKVVKSNCQLHCVCVPQSAQNISTLAGRFL